MRNYLRNGEFVFHGLFVANLILETAVVFAAPPPTFHAQATLHESTAACLLVAGSAHHPAHEKHHKCEDLPAEMKRVVPRETRYYANKESAGNGMSAGGTSASGNKENEARTLLTVNILSGFMPTAKPALAPMRGPLPQIHVLTPANGYTRSPRAAHAFNGRRLCARMALG